MVLFQIGALGSRHGRGLCARTRLSFVLLAGLALVPSARCDIASALIKFENTLRGRFALGGFPTGDFTIASVGGYADGFMVSRTTHGPWDIKDFPHTLPFQEHTESNGDTENSKNSVNFFFAPDFTGLLDLEHTVNFSDSQAASSGGLFHLAYSNAVVSAFQVYEVDRKPGTGIVAPPIFAVHVSSDAGAVHMLAHKEGNASALATFRVALAGAIRTRAVPDAPWEAIPDNEILYHAIEANDEWMSPAVDQSMWLNLPDWTRLSGAKFDLRLGFRADMFTAAQVVPEPSGLLVLTLGAMALLRRKRLWV